VKERREAELWMKGSDDESSQKKKQKRDEEKRWTSEKTKKVAQRDQHRPHKCHTKKQTTVRKNDNGRSLQR